MRLFGLTERVAEVVPIAEVSYRASQPVDALLPSVVKITNIAPPLEVTLEGIVEPLNRPSCRALVEVPS